MVVGLTVVAFGTSAPELAVSVKAAFAGQAELAIANVVGSNIFNVLFILGLSALIFPLVISRQLIRQDVPLMVGISVVAVIMTLDGSISRWEAILLAIGLVSYTGFLFYQGKKQGMDVSDEEVEELLKVKVPAWQNLLLVIGGLVLLVLGARWVASQASKPEGTSPSDCVRSAAARVARWLAYSFCGWPACPFTQLHCTACRRAAATSACQSARFSISPSFLFQPRLAQPCTQLVIPSIR